jgi:hypothetical protein
MITQNLRFSTKWNMGDTNVSKASAGFDLFNLLKLEFIELLSSIVSDEVNEIYANGPDLLGLPIRQSTGLVVGAREQKKPAHPAL